MSKAAKATFRREDRDGHLEPTYVASLLARAKELRAADEPKPFVERGVSTDDLAEELGEETVRSMTSGEYCIAARRDEFMDEEGGGPFVVSQASEEFANGIDDSNPEDALVEPFPRT